MEGKVVSLFQWAPRHKVMWESESKTVPRFKQPTRCNNFRSLIFLLIYLNLRFERQARLSSGAHLTVYTASVQYTDISAYRWQGWGGTEFHLILVTGRQQYRCIAPKLYIYSQMCSWRWTSLSPETGRTDSNRWIKRSLNENCCILLVAYIVVLMMHGLTNAKLYGCRMWLGLNRGHFTTDKVAVAPIPWTCVFSWYWGTTFHEYDNTKTIIINNKPV